MNLYIYIFFPPDSEEGRQDRLSDKFDQPQEKWVLQHHVSSIENLDVQSIELCFFYDQ